MLTFLKPGWHTLFFYFSLYFFADKVVGRIMPVRDSSEEFVTPLSPNSQAIQDRLEYADRNFETFIHKVREQGVSARLFKEKT